MLLLLLLVFVLLAVVVLVVGEAAIVLTMPCIIICRWNALTVPRVRSWRACEELFAFFVGGCELTSVCEYVCECVFGG